MSKPQKFEMPVEDREGLQNLALRGISASS